MTCFWPKSSCKCLWPVDNESGDNELRPEKVDPRYCPLAVCDETLNFFHHLAYVQHEKEGLVI